MWKQKVGSRIGRYTLAVFGLAFVATAAVNSGGLATSVALAAEENVAVASVFPSVSERVSPFFATPALEELLVNSSRARLADCSDDFESQNNSYTEWWINTNGVWDCITDGVGVYTLDWFWYLYESDGSTPLVSCAESNVAVSGGGGACNVNYYDYFDYDCVGDEEFHVYYRLYGQQNYVGPLINDDGPTYGCAY